VIAIVVISAIRMWQSRNLLEDDGSVEAPDIELRALETSVQKDPSLPTDLLHSCLQEMGAFHAADAASRSSKQGLPLLRRLHEWNDAFRTLKLVHALRDKGLPSLPLHQAVEQAPFVPPLSSEKPGEVLEELRHLALTLCANRKVGLDCLPENDH